MRITRKLGLLVSVPLVAVLAFATLTVVTTWNDAVRADHLRGLVVTGAEAGELAHRLQRERAAALLVLTGGPAATDLFIERVAATEQQVGPYRQARAGLTAALPARTGTLLARIESQLAGLPRLRELVEQRRGAASAVAFAYRILVADLIDLRESVAQAAPADVADRVRAGAALSIAAEQIGRQQVAVLRAVEFGSLTPAAGREVIAAQGGHEEALLTFDRLATPAWRAALDRAATSEDALAARRLEDQVARTPAGTRLRVDPAEWTAALDGSMRRLRETEAQVDADLLREVTALRAGARQLTGGQITAVVLAVAVAVAVTVVLGRPVVRGLRQLRDAAHDVAYSRLPAAVRALEDSAALGDLSPEQFADQAEPPVAVRGQDELAEVGAAFNTVHREAVRTAAEQAKLRLSIAAIMRNLARRGQKLTDRLTAALDDVERDELNPRRLSQLYQLDLMATLLGGTNESLLVLGGAGAAQVRTVDEPLAAVVRAAQGRVEQYQRIETGVIDEGVLVRAIAIDDVVKLVAELLDNACRYSSPTAPVRLDARWLSDRVIVQISDEGIGIDAERRQQLNDRLATRPPLDLAAVEAMGLTVVAYLAARHRLRVELKAAAPDGRPGGTIAEVTLPPDLVAIGPSFRNRAGGLVPPWPPLPDQTRPAITTTPAPETHPYRSAPGSRWFTHARYLAGARPDPSWGTAADAGWQAAAGATRPQPAGTTSGGLPVRRPGAQLVPGGVEPETNRVPATEWRDPVRAGAVAAAYSRGLTSGRSVKQPLVEETAS